MTASQNCGIGALWNGGWSGASIYFSVHGGVGAWFFALLAGAAFFAAVIFSVLSVLHYWEDE